MERNQNTLKVTEIINDNIKTELNKSNFVFDVPTETQIQTDMHKFIKKEKKPRAPPPPYESPLPLTDEEIRKIHEEEKNNFLKGAIAINKLELDAATESTNDKNEQIIRDIIDPTPDLFVDDNLNF